MSTPVEYASFLIRLWREARAAGMPAGEWHSEIEHIQSGRRWTFDTMEELLDFFRREAENLSGNTTTYLR